MLSRSFLVFAAGGVVGFLVDSAVFLAANHLLGNPYLARWFSYLAAVTTTWLLNRRYAFHAEPLNLGLPILFEWLRYLTTQLLGFAVNYAVFSALIYLVALFARVPVLAIGVGSLSGLVVNYTAARLLVFRQASEGD